MMQKYIIFVREKGPPSEDHRTGCKNATIALHFRLAAGISGLIIHHCNTCVTFFCAIQLRTNECKVSQINYLRLKCGAGHHPLAGSHRNTGPLLAKYEYRLLTRELHAANRILNLSMYKIQKS